MKFENLKKNENKLQQTAPKKKKHFFLLKGFLSKIGVPKKTSGGRSSCYFSSKKNRLKFLQCFRYSFTNSYFLIAKNFFRHNLGFFDEWALFF